MCKRCRRTCYGYGEFLVEAGVQTETSYCIGTEMPPSWLDMQHEGMQELLRSLAGCAPMPTLRLFESAHIITCEQPLQRLEVQRLDNRLRHRRDLPFIDV